MDHAVAVRAEGDELVDGIDSVAGREFAHRLEVMDMDNPLGYFAVDLAHFVSASLAAVIVIAQAGHARPVVALVISPAELSPLPGGNTLGIDVLGQRSIRRFAAIGGIPVCIAFSELAQCEDGNKSVNLCRPLADFTLLGRGEDHRIRVERVALFLHQVQMLARFLVSRFSPSGLTALPSFAEYKRLLAVGMSIPRAEDNELFAVIDE